MSQLCTAAGCARPTSAVLCKDCVHQLEEALAKLASWAKPPPGVHLGTASAVQMPDHHVIHETTPVLLSAGNYGRSATTIWDLTAGIGGAKGLASELDTARARQGRRGDQSGPRPAPDSKVWAPSRRLDRIERDLASAVAHWIATLNEITVTAPRTVTTGHLLARGCTWLLWHVHDVAVHADAGAAHAAFTRAARDVTELVDRPADRVYVGPCWRIVDGLECETDLYATPGSPDVQCRACGFVHDVEVRKKWLADHLEEMPMPAADACRALAQIGLQVRVGAITMWATRGELTSIGKRNIGGHSRPLYRVGDVMLLAYKAAEDPRAAKRDTLKVG